jgi:16S rRNA (guanine1207-N2)-methyltransferase
MSAESLKTLFHPFEAGVLAAPASGARALFLGAESGFRLPESWQAPIHAVQGFRPDFRALERMGLASVAPQAEGEAYATALVLAGRHRGLNELRIADAIERTVPGALILIAGSKGDGIASLRKRLGGLIIIEGSLPKYHCLAFWFHRPSGDEAAKVLRAANPSMLVEGRFHTAPGMFSFDRVDGGSNLLANHLPDDLRGHVADFCAGWGYLSAEVLARCPGIAALDLYEADFEALEAAKKNLAGAGFGPRFFWHDLLGEPVGERYDAIVMNPPFHRARATEPEIGAGMVRAAAKALKPGGRLFMVANRQLPYEPVLAAAFSSHGEIARDGMFKVFSARR